MAGGAQAEGRPGARYLRSGGGLLLLRASFGRPGPHRTLALVRLAPDSFPSLSPFLPLPRPWLQDGGAETDHVSGEPVSSSDVHRITLQRLPCDQALGSKKPPNQSCGTGRF
ncbi:mCG21289 [Mus musculus]|nr:mCG21289 [Mus musculus]